MPWALFTLATRASVVGAVPTTTVNLGATSFCSWRQAREGDRKEEEGLRGQRKLVTAWTQTEGHEFEEGIVDERGGGEARVSSGTCSGRKEASRFQHNSTTLAETKG